MDVTRQNGGILDLAHEMSFCVLISNLPKFNQS
jgi:hypothetical protein